MLSESVSALTQRERLPKAATLSASVLTWNRAVVVAGGGRAVGVGSGGSSGLRSGGR